jgi:hypothetical protein
VGASIPMKLFKRYHPLAVAGGWAVCDGNLAQRDATKNEPARAIDERVMTKEQAQAECERLNKP